MSRTTNRSVVVAVATAFALAALIAPTGGAQQPGERTLKVIEKEDTVAFADVAPRSPNRKDPSISAGDLNVFTSTLSDESGRRLGRLDGACIAVRGGKTFQKARFQCTGTFTLHDGLIEVGVGFGASQSDDSVSLVITGGTGAYEGARGHVSSRDLPGGRMEDTFHLLP